MIPTVLDDFATPPCATHLGLDILEADRDDGSVVVSFIGKAEFCNAAGNIQGGFLAAMLDDCMGPAVLIATNAEFYPATINLNVSFFRPAQVGSILGRGCFRRTGKTIGYVEACLFDSAGSEIARASSSVRLVAMHKVGVAPA